MAKIYSPNKEYTGISASVSFLNGVGETNDERLVKWFKEHGYQVEETDDFTEKDISKKDKPKKN